MSRTMKSSSDLQSLLERPLRDVPNTELSDIFLTASKPDTAWSVGLEWELFVVDAATGKGAEYASLSRLVAKLAEALGWPSEFEASGDLIGCAGEGASVSLEPGGQIEYASRPHRAMKSLVDELASYASSLTAMGEDLGLCFWCIGRHPYLSAGTAPKMPKERYDIMRSYLGRRDTRGLDMMHLTTSVQCAVDFASEENMVNKVRTASWASPFITALTASSPFTDGKLNGMKSDRYEIWRHTDPDRCGIWPEMIDSEGLTLDRYLTRVLDTPAMFFMRNGRHVLAEPKPYRTYRDDGFQGTEVTVQDLLDHLTTFFPEIRVKGYVELRGADCLQLDEAVAVAGIWRGLLDDEATRKEADARLSPLSHLDVETLQADVARLGLEAMSPIGPVSEIAAWLVELAYGRMGKSAPDCAECIEPLRERAQERRSPADDLIREFAASGSLPKALQLVTV
jgi:glutamate--cysteine ligase